jgi:hypothetical protein
MLFAFNATFSHGISAVPNVLLSPSSSRTPPGDFSMPKHMPGEQPRQAVDLLSHTGSHREISQCRNTLLGERPGQAVDLLSHREAMSTNSQGVGEVVCSGHSAQRRGRMHDGVVLFKDGVILNGSTTALVVVSLVVSVIVAD